MPEDWISSQETEHNARTKSTMAVLDKWWLRENTMSAATVMWVDLLSFASSSFGFLDRLPMTT
jgi:hypothetical protein